MRRRILVCLLFALSLSAQTLFANVVQDAIDALPASGGVVQLDPTTYLIDQTIVIGDATSTLPSSRNGITLAGTGSGASDTDMGPGLASAPTRLVWVGPSGGTMIKINGPVSGVVIRDLMLDGNGTAGTLIESQRSFNQLVDNVVLRQWANAYAIKIHASNLYSGISGGGAPHQQSWRHVYTVEPADADAGGIQIGQGAGNVNQLNFERCTFLHGADVPGIDLGYCDHINFVSCFTGIWGAAGGVGVGVQVSPQSGHTDFPTNVVFMGSPIAGGVAMNGSWTGVLNAALLFYPYYTADGQPLPPVGANSTTLPPLLIGGFTDTGVALGYQHEPLGSASTASTLTPPAQTFTLDGTGAVSGIAEPPTTFNRTSSTIRVRPLDRWRMGLDAGPPSGGGIGVPLRAIPGSVLEFHYDTDSDKWWPNGKYRGTGDSELLYLLKTPSSAVSNTNVETAFNQTAKIPANSLFLPGTVVRIRATGKFSKTIGATVNFDVRIKLGSTVLTASNLNVVNGAADYAWYATAEFVVLSTGSSGSLRRAGGELGFAFTDSTPAWNVGDSTLDTTTEQTISVTVTPSVASPSNTLTLETITVRADYPAQTG
jgi:hypothetical protein